MAKDEQDAVKQDVLDTVFAGEEDNLDNDDTLHEGEDDHSDDIPDGDQIDDEDEGRDQEDDDNIDLSNEEDEPPAKKPQKAEKRQTRSATKLVGDRGEKLTLKPEEITGKYSVDQSGNVVINGRVVAKAGTERKVFEMFRNSFENANAQQLAMTKHIEQVVSAGRELKKRYDDLQENKNYGEKIGLDNAEQRQALDIAALAKQDPKTAVKKFLTLMQLNGTTLEDIGTDVPLDAKTVAEQAVAQYIREQEAKAKKDDEGHTTEPVDDPVYQEAVTFLNDNPRAAKFVKQLDKAKARFPHLSYEQCWTLLKQGIKRANEKARGSTGKQPSDPGNPPPRSRRKRTISSRNVSVDPNQSFKQIGADLLKELSSKE